MSNTIRAFIAIDVPERIRSGIIKVQEEFRKYEFKIRWVRPENIHLSLKFLGNIKTVDIEKIGEVLFETVKVFPPILLEAKGIGVFPGIKRPRVVWVGLAGEIEPLFGLYESLEENLETIGFPRDKRRFKGHMTLGRIKDKINPKTFGDALMAVRSFESETFTADRVVLYQSELKPSGAVYTKLVDASLGKGN